MKRMVILDSPYEPAKVLATLEREMDREPGLLWTALTFNAFYFSGTAPVCGTVGDAGFRIRNRSGPALSLYGRGRIEKTSSGTRVVVDFARPWLPDLVGILFNRYERDFRVIVDFLKRVLNAEESGEPINAPPEGR